MSHFTYNDVFNSNELSQGDVLKKTSELVEVIDKVHPYFNSTNYSHFIILTQSCDLVRRKENCKARYITIAAVRSLEDALKREALEYANSKLEIITKQLLDQKNSSKLSDFLARLFNNNIPDYFYLHPEVSRDFANPSVAFLRVSIALKSEIHYEACLAAKVLELSENFKSKLGWLVGNLYSRVGTEDWVPNNKDQQGFNSFVKKHLESNFTIIQNITELEKEILKSHSEDQIKAMSIEDIIQLIKGIKLPTKKEKALKQIIDIISSSKCLKDDYNIEKLLSKLNNDPSLTSLLK